MKLIQVGASGRERPALIAEDGRAFSLSPLTPCVDGVFLAGGGIERARAGFAEGLLPEIDISTERLGAPITRPGKVICIGLNYRDHAAETGAQVPTRPIVFLKSANTVVGPEDEILIPRGSQKTDYEVELGVVLGARARYLESPEAARSVIAGYVVSHDVSEREFQLEFSGQWDLGKSCETFNPLGPWLVPADEIDPAALELWLTVNGEERQRGDTKEMVFDPAYLVWYLSQYMVLEPGDLINTGTPAGVALGRPDTPYLRAGDIVELGIAGLGTQRQKVGQA
ncbi:MAG TPA: fumarylacetoacetate hydrolase family protein [Actinokineospora sp.]|jgi:2-keto-4-pentenoate hydratase/2-oxohepta-3-ene-1,7-dioic acid hydratase in catechol pathway|nr:fumarylacetoacetate hydrolase family protein [Actinokineospora sp.]